MDLAAVTLDAAGTLFTPREPVGRTYARMAALHGINLDARVASTRFRGAMRDAPPLAFPGVLPARRPDHERAWWQVVVRVAFGAAERHPAFGPCFEDLFAHFARPEAWRLFPGALAALRALRAAKLRLAVVSNFDGRLGGLLAGLGIAPLLDAVVASAAHGAAKPDPHLFLAAAALLETPPGSILHVGDDLEADVRGAQRAGLHALLVLHGDDVGAPPDVPVLRSLRDLPAAVTTWAAACPGSERDPSTWRVPRPRGVPRPAKPTRGP